MNCCTRDSRHPPLLPRPRPRRRRGGCRPLPPLPSTSHLALVVEQRDATQRRPGTNPPTMARGTPPRLPSPRPPGSTWAPEKADLGRLPRMPPAVVGGDQQRHGDERRDKCGRSAEGAAWYSLDLPGADRGAPSRGAQSRGIRPHKNRYERQLGDWPRHHEEHIVAAGIFGHGH